MEQRCHTTQTSSACVATLVFTCNYSNKKQALFSLGHLNFVFD